MSHCAGSRMPLYSDLCVQALHPLSHNYKAATALIEAHWLIS